MACFQKWRHWRRYVLVTWAWVDLENSTLAWMAWYNLHVNQKIINDAEVACPFLRPESNHITPRLPCCSLTQSAVYGIPMSLAQTCDFPETSSKSPATPSSWTTSSSYVHARHSSILFMRKKIKIRNSFCVCHSIRLFFTLQALLWEFSRFCWSVRSCVPSCNPTEDKILDLRRDPDANDHIICEDNSKRIRTFYFPSFLPNVRVQRLLSDTARLHKQIPSDWPSGLWHETSSTSSRRKTKIFCNWRAACVFWVYPSPTAALQSSENRWTQMTTLQAMSYLVLMWLELWSACPVEKSEFRESTEVRIGVCVSHNVIVWRKIGRYIRLTKLGGHKQVHQAYFRNRLQPPQHLVKICFPKTFAVPPSSFEESLLTKCTRPRLVSPKIECTPPAWKLSPLWWRQVWRCARPSYLSQFVESVLYWSVSLDTDSWSKTKSRGPKILLHNSSSTPQQITWMVGCWQM